MHQTTRFLVLALVAACLELILTGTTALPVELCGQRLENRLILVCRFPVAVADTQCCRGEFCQPDALESFCYGARRR
jgi:hypothetical protein